jgi:osmotically-inducible protein OsmY
MRIWRNISLVWGLALVMGGVGTSRLTAAPGPAAGDAAVAQAIRRRFESAPGVPSYLINITVENGRATLSGAVDDLLARDRAGQLAETIRGVSSVRNQIQVLPAARSSADIYRCIQNALTEAPALNGDTINAGVQGGFVTLSGTVTSWPERHLAGLLTEGVPGVKGIDNKLRVVYGIPRSDARIRADIQSRIRWDPCLITPELQVEVSRGGVRLKGFVESDSALAHVYQDGWVNGVNSVDVSGIEIVPSVRVAMNHSGAESGSGVAGAGRLTDAELQAAIARACYYDPLLRPDHLNVRVENGVATLRGNVANLQAKDAAQELAQDFAGPGQVQDLIQIQKIGAS